MNFAWETDPIALAVLVMALVLGVAAGAATFYFGLEGGLRRRRSPNQVMLESIAAGIVLAGAIGSFATFGIVYFVGSLIAGVVLLGLARGLTRLTMGLFALALVLAVMAFLSRPHSAKPSLPPPLPANTTDATTAPAVSPPSAAPSPALPASTPAAAPATPPPKPAPPPASDTPFLRRIAPKDEQPLITPVPAPAAPAGSPAR